MTVSIKDGFKLLGLAIVSGCAVFVMTFFLSFYLDAVSVRESVSPSALPLYEAQILTAKLVCAVSGGVLGIVAVVLTVFYVKLYLDSHTKQMGLLKAMGYGEGKIALGFWVFGLSVFLGTAVGFGCGYAIAPVIYRSMGGGDLPEIAVRFHAQLLAFLVLLPSILFTMLAVVYARFSLKKPACDLLRGIQSTDTFKTRKREKDRPFLLDFSFRTLGSKKSLAFFVGFACFCFSAMLQMACSMDEYASITMGAIIFGIGVVLSVTSLLLAFTSVANANAKSVALMKAFGYTLPQCGNAVLGAYRIAAGVGFAVGTVYQYALIKLMIDGIFGDAGAPPYSFDWIAFACVLAAFLVLYECATLLFTLKMGKTSLRKLTVE